MRPIPRAKAPDATLPMMFGSGYEYIRNQARALGTDLFRTRALLRSAVCLTGEEGAKLFYDTELFMRKGAALDARGRGVGPRRFPL
jgi:fatty-acid peroxygenase